MNTSMTLSSRRDRSGATIVLHRVLRVGFWFFMVKGLLWLAVPVALHQVLTG
jgi:hypothetical protein